MSLFSSIRMAVNTLQANEVALQVVGQNIANANTPGYIREEVLFSPAPTQRNGKLLMGLGVQVDAIVQKIDKFLEERLRGSISDRVDAETREAAYMQLEGLIGELSDTDLSTSLNNFFNTIHEILNQSGGVSARNLTVLQGNTLTTDLNRLADRAMKIRSDLNDHIFDMAADINRLTEAIRVLNVRITQIEGGNVSASDAVGLRDQRLMALENLAKLVEIRVKEQESGAVIVYSGSQFLVFEGEARQVEVVLDSDRGLSVANIHMANTDAPLDTASGELRGLLDSRDQIIGGFLDRLDNFAHTLAFEFNKAFSQGQGLNGFQDLTSEFAVDQVDAALNEAGLKFMPVNGSFQVIVHNKQTGDTEWADVVVDLNGLDSDMTLENLADALDDVDGISATTTSGRKLRITTDSPELEFFFHGDTSGVLAVLGLNTFFTGSTALDIGVNAVLKADPSKFAASLVTADGDFTQNTANAEVLAALQDRRIASQNNETLNVLYDRMIGETTQAASIAGAVAEGARVFEQTLRGQKMATSGVSLDEEAVNMIAFQRSFQASAKYIATLTELFEILVEI
ncbi:MAG TPA: flagellar hook-associated protein FlgK [Thermoguttaceae bacterium]|nr:flagellar hook-associated protein FlgK [Thermoguttaceae bacterium]